MKKVMLLCAVVAFFVGCNEILTEEIKISVVVKPPDSGSVSPGSGEYISGSMYDFLATPNDGWRFSHWERDGSGEGNPLQMIIFADYVITAVFEPVDGSPFAWIDTPADNIEVTQGTFVNFFGYAVGGTPPYTCVWDYKTGDTRTPETCRGVDLHGYAFTQSGTFDVSFTVTDSNSEVASDTVEVTVIPIIQLAIYLCDELTRQTRAYIGLPE
jgi:hypothetical protein